MCLVSSKYSFFSSNIYTLIPQGTILSIQGSLGSARITDSVFVFAFLWFQRGHDNPTYPPFEGWAEVPDVQQFLDSVRWFLLDIFGTQIVYTAIMYKALLWIHELMESQLLTQAWPSIDKQEFSMVIRESTHSLWVDLLHWHDAAEEVSLLYKSAVYALRMHGASP